MYYCTNYWNNLGNSRFWSWVGGAVVSTVEDMSQDSASADSTMESVNFMLKFIGSFIVVIIGGVLGIVGSKKHHHK